MNSFLSPVYFVVDGPLSWLLALTRSVWSDDRQRANTDSPEVEREKKINYYGGEGGGGEDSYILSLEVQG